ncbi:S-adenosylhomocysteine deaminase [Marinobacterium nitratireducens]|uniref:S-adenosylhomocysteine deaminase n=1 Tax=Marinobacterium nitratireducens TaxID=518897 RepID=A0A917ZJ17_9GAMM|nr:amidohydrolase family protein [Marinobacterium nitratireducens]GGO83566.1 S-adenosylhomocysteine deaminase [Marinobacterium nitratireducens]
MHKHQNSEPFEADDLILAPEWMLLPQGPVRQQALRVADGRFADVGSLCELQARYPELEVRRIEKQLLMPGFVDTHHHLSQTFGKSLVFGEPSEIFRRVWVPMESGLDEELLYLTTKLAALESLRGGFTTVCDAGTRAETGLKSMAVACEEAGLRTVLGLVCNDRRGDEVLAPGPILTKAEQHLADWESNPMVKPSLAIPIPEIATDDMLRAVSALCAEAGTVFQTHANEHLVAVERSLERYGVRPVEHLHRAGALGPQALLAHATLLTPGEIAMIRDSDTAVSYNPVASAWKGNAVAQAELMRTFGVRLGLGTDGTRSDAFRLMDFAEAAQRFAHGLAVGDSSCGGGWSWLEMATREGARVLGLETGEIAVGKAADFLLVDLQVPEMTPSWDLSWELVRLANRDQIQAVYVGGRLRLWQGWPVDWDARALMQQVDELARAVVERAPIQKIHPFSQAHREARGPDSDASTSGH